jgi:uncharacterized RDD family membrane protein YckC
MSRAKRASNTAEPVRTFVTPEGVDLKLRVGDAGARAGAFLIDVAVIGLFLTVLTFAALGALWASRLQGGEMVQVIWILGAFLLRNFYFMGFELRPGAATPGKRMMGLRVIARDGGRLTADAVFARNAMRELEVFLPATFLFARGAGVDGWLVLLGVLWTGVFLVFPLFNRDRLRLGDLAAGTLVILSPKRVLRPDLSAAPAAGGPVFTTAQLDAYGVKELHVLEDVLRQGDRRTLAAVSERIRRKIGWTAPLEASDAAFLSAYYAGLRGRLEGQLLFGRRRKDKFDTP